MQQKRSTRIRLALAGVLTLASASSALAADGPPPGGGAPGGPPPTVPAPPPPPPPPSSPAAGDAAAERAAVIRDVTGSEDIVVVDRPFRFDGPIVDLESVSPLGFAQGPVVPLDAPGTRDVLSPVRVRDLTPTSVSEVVGHLPGVTSRLYSGDEYMRPSISSRGMPDNGFTEHVSVLVDGFNMSTLAYGWTAISIFPFTAERIWAAEVYRGAYAVRYGPNNMGGVVNLVTAPIPMEPTFRERVVFGSFDYHSTFTEAGGTDRSGRFGVLLAFVEKGGDTFRDDNRFDVNEFSLKTRWNIDDGSWLAVNGAHWRAVHQIPGRLTKAQLDADRTQNPNPHAVDWHGWSYWGTATYHRDVACDGWFEAMAYYRLAHRALDSARPPAGPPFTIIRSSDSDSYNAGFELRGEFDAHLGVAHRLHWGARYHREWIDRQVFDDPIVPGPRVLVQDARTTTHVISGNIDDTVRLGRFVLSLGVRGEWMVDSFGSDEVTGNGKSYEFSDLLPGGSIVYEINDRWSLFANANATMRAPQVFDYDFTKPQQRFTFEHGETYEVGTRWERLACGLSGSLAAWQVDYSDFIEYDAVLDVVTNHGGYRSRGLDLAADVDFGAFSRRLRGLSLYGSVTRQESEIQVGANEGNTPFQVPDWLAAGGIRYEHRSGAYGSVDFAYRGFAYVTDVNDTTTAPYAIFGARAGWRRTLDVGCAQLEFDAAVGVKNLFDKEYELRHSATLYVPGAPREVFAEVGFGVEF